ncbi:MAG: hypothetical protein QM756_17450 [Polyangiaceae bacterium]
MHLPLALLTLLSTPADAARSATTSNAVALSTPAELAAPSGPTAQKPRPKPQPRPRPEPHCPACGMG